MMHLLKIFYGIISSLGVDFFSELSNVVDNCFDDNVRLVMGIHFLIQLHNFLFPYFLFFRDCNGPLSISKWFVRALS